MGAAVSIDVPLSQAHRAQLESKYNSLASAGISPRSIQSKYIDAKPGIVLYNQIDCDHSGTVSRKELMRMLKALPRSKPKPPAGGWPDGVAPKFVPFEEMLTTLDSDGDGEISMEEWLGNYGKLAGLKAAVDQALDPATGKIQGYLSLEERLLQLKEKKKEALASVANYDKQIVSLEKQVGSAGILVFRQIDIDHSGKVERKELLRVLKCLPKPSAPTSGKMSIEDIIASLDSDGDGIIDEAEWLANLDSLPDLKASIELAVDPKTGLIRGYRSLEQQLAKLHDDFRRLVPKVAAGEAGAKEEQDKKLEAIEKLEAKGIIASDEGWENEPEQIETKEEHLATLHHQIPELLEMAEAGVEGAATALTAELAEAVELEAQGVVAVGESGVAVHDHAKEETKEEHLATLHHQIPELAVMANAGIPGSLALLEKEIMEAEELEEEGVVAKGEEWTSEPLA